jgi:hypothetical protein
VEWTQRRILGLSVVIAFLAVFLIISAIPEDYFLVVPTITVSRSGEYNGGYPQVGYPSVSYSEQFIFSTTGSFSVNNPVTVKVNITNVNITDFLTFYRGIAFPDAYPSSNINFSLNGVPDNAIIALKDDGNGTYTGENTIVWLFEGPTYPILVPTNITASFSQETPPPSGTILTIASISDTLSIKFNESTSKLAWQLGSFGIVALEPAFEAIFLKEEKPRQNLQKNS